MFVPVQQDYLLFIVNKLATFCVTFLTEVKRKRKKTPRRLVCRLFVGINKQNDNKEFTCTSDACFSVSGHTSALVKCLDG